LGCEVTFLEHFPSLKEKKNRLTRSTVCVYACVRARMRDICL